MKVVFKNNELIVDEDKFTWQLPEGMTAVLKKCRVQGFNDYDAEDLYGEYDFPSVRLMFGDYHFKWGTTENCVYVMLNFESTYSVPFDFRREFLEVHCGDKVYPVRYYRNTYHQYEDKNNPLTVGELIKKLQTLDPNLKVDISTTADCGYINAGGRVHDIVVDDEYVTFYSEEGLDYNDLYGEDDESEEDGELEEEI